MTGLKKIISLWVIMSMALFVGVNLKAADGSQASNKQLININNADASQLDRLPRVGEKIALRIIEYRKKNGNFKKIEDLMKVKGIGPKIFERMKNLITV